VGETMPEGWAGPGPGAATPHTEQKRDSSGSWCPQAVQNMAQDYRSARRPS
jgi:hypothetical protein